MNDPLIPQHKRMAMGEDISDGGENFGCDSLASTSSGRDHPDRAYVAPKRGLKDGRRSAMPPISRGEGSYGAQANPDHGPH